MKTAKPLFALPLALSDAAEPAKPFQILKAGRYKHRVYGAFEITAADLRAFKANFDKRVLGIDVVVNYDHCTSVAHGNKAAGWLRGLELRNNDSELWATPEWTPEALRAIKDGEWKYSSAEINPQWEHPETGERHSRVLLGVALTNVPFIKGMEKIAASDNATHHDHAEEIDQMKLTEIQALLLSEHGINLTDLQAHAAKVKGLEDQVKTLSASVTASDRAVADAKAKVDELTKKLSDAEKAGAEAKFAALVEKGMKDGKLTKAFAEGGFRKVFEAQGLAFAESMLAELPVVVPVGGLTGHGGTGDADGGKKFKTPDLEVVAKANELMAKDAKLAFSDAASHVLRNDADLAKRYHAWQGEGAEAADA